MVLDVHPHALLLPERTTPAEVRSRIKESLKFLLGRQIDGGYYNIQGVIVDSDLRVAKLEVELE